jgi:hypothetical protein
MRCLVFACVCVCVCVWVWVWVWVWGGVGGGAHTHPIRAARSFNAIISDRDSVQYYWPAWRAAIQGGKAASVMCRYPLSVAHAIHIIRYRRTPPKFGILQSVCCAFIRQLQQCERRAFMCQRPLLEQSAA